MTWLKVLNVCLIGLCLFQYAVEGQGEMTIDLLVVVDNRLYNSWLKKYNNDAAKTNDELNYIFAHIVQGLDKKFRSIKTSRNTYGVKMVKLVIAKTPDMSPFTKGSGMLNSHEALRQFSEWAKVEIQNNRLPSYDIAGIFTSEKSASSGYGMLGTVCESNGVFIYPMSGIYDAINLAAHEMGHNLGSEHDGEGNNCRYNDQYLMAAVQEATEKNNHHTFSSCSINYFDKKIDQLNKDNKNCLKQNAKSYADVSQYLKTLAGQKFTLDQQCEHIYGKGSYFCHFGGELAPEEVCKSILCFDPNGDRTMCFQSNSLRGLDGTPCGNKKWCMDGKCVQDNKAPANKDYCLFGDANRNMNFNGRDVLCPSLKNDKKSCGMGYFEKKCCKTCDELADKKNPNCKYGDQWDNCKSWFDMDPGACKRDPNVGKNCCGTCSKVK